MPFCEHCGNEIGYLPFKCRYCGGTMCNKHRLPENHECTFELKHTPIVPITSRESRTKYQDVTVKRATPGGYDRRREKEVKKYIYELGVEGRLLNMQVEELMANIVNDSLNIISDYAHPDIGAEPFEVKDRINLLSEEELLELSNIVKILGYDVEGSLKEFDIHPKGLRIVSEVRRLPQSIVANLIDKFGNLKNILNANVNELSEVAGMGKIRARSLYDKLKKFSEYYLYNEPYNRKGGVTPKIKI